MNTVFNKLLHGRVKRSCYLFCTIALMTFSGSVWAIPSPDLVINLTASLAQILGMASVLAGGLFVSRKKPANKVSPYGRPSNNITFICVVSILLISGAANIWQFARHSDIRTEQLNANLYRKATENGREVGGVSLKTLSVSEQIASDRGITTAKLSSMYGLEAHRSIMAPMSPVTLIDVREDEEVEGGRIPGAIHIRYPDLLKNPDLLGSGENVVLLCYSGNRSSELASALADQGYNARFMIGGYEKWMAENRALDVVTGDRKSLREIPLFENRDTLLETTEVSKLIQNDDAVFVDVRYPAEFEANHLPGAINLTVRAEDTDSLRNKLSAIPRKTVIGVCYDRRSCFYSQILGLKLTRLGYQFAGRYTVPHEYVQPRKGSGKTYVSDWQAQQQASLLGMVRIKIGEKLSALKENTGSVLLTLLVVVLAIRLPLLPLTIKMERDRLVLKRLAPALRRIKNRHVADLSARGLATSTLHNENRIAPMLTLVGSLVNLGLMFLMFSIVSQQAENWTSPLLWVESASLPDQSKWMAAIITVLVLTLAVVMYRPLTKVRCALIALGVGTTTLLVIPLSAALNVYVALSLLVVFVQMAFISLLDRYYGWSGDGKKERANESSAIFPLEIAHKFPMQTGKKAARLGELIQAGYNVPAGFVVNKLAVDQSGQSVNSTLTSELSKAWKNLSAKKVAVRSSGVAEDGDNASFAGVYDSALNIQKPELQSTIKLVARSLDTGLRSEYAKGQITDVENADGGVLVQRMIAAEYAGVLFTEHPSTSGKMLIEMVAGLGESLVSGTVTPTTHEFGRRSFSSDTDTDTEIDLTPLLKTAVKIEQRFGKPQDIEWAYKGGEFFILQARDITRSVTDFTSVHGLIERERSDLLSHLSYAAPDEVVLEQNELSELLPRPTQISFSFMQKLWECNGSTHLACERLNIPYRVNAASPAYVNQFFGWLYVNKAEERRRIRSGPGALASFKLSRDAEVIADHFEQQFLPGFVRRMNTLKALDFDRLSVEELVDLFSFHSNRFVTETYVEAEVINICNQFYWNAASAKLSRSNIDPNTVLGSVPENVVGDAMNLLARSNDDPSRIEDFLELFGHRAPTDYEFSQPRFCEDMDLVQKQIAQLGGKTISHSEPLELGDRMLQISVERVRRFQALKENAKHHCLREFHLLRKVLLALDAKCKLDGGIFHLDCDEVGYLSDQKYIAVAKQLIRIRKTQAAEYQEFEPPAKLTLAGIEEFDPLAKEKQNVVDRPDSVRGTRVAGEQAVSGVVHVIRDEAELDKFREGEILVAKMTDPSW